MSGWLAMMFMVQVIHHSLLCFWWAALPFAFACQLIPIGAWFSQMCETLDVYGFEAYTNPRAPHPYHYFDKVKAVLQHHSFDFAVEAYKLLGKVHPVTLHI